jgi:hypothetical protein
MDDRQPNPGLPFRHRCRNLVTTTSQLTPATAPRAPYAGAAGNFRSPTARSRDPAKRCQSPQNPGLDRPRPFMDDIEGNQMRALGHGAGCGCMTAGAGGARDVAGHAAKRRCRLQDRTARRHLDGSDTPAVEHEESTTMLTAEHTGILSQR